MNEIYCTNSIIRLDKCIGVCESVVKATGGDCWARNAKRSCRGQMTGERIYWLLNTIVTFPATIYDDWNSGQFSHYTSVQRYRTTKVQNETPCQTSSISGSA